MPSHSQKHCSAVLTRQADKPNIVFKCEGHILFGALQCFQNTKRTLNQTVTRITPYTRRVFTPRQALSSMPMCIRFEMNSAPKREPYGQPTRFNTERRVRMRNKNHISIIIFPALRFFASESIPGSSESCSFLYIMDETSSLPLSKSAIAAGKVYGFM